jgi:hypothetical protein
MNIFIYKYIYIYIYIYIYVYIYIYIYIYTVYYEELARESLRIRSLIISSNYHLVGRACSLLADTLREQDQLVDETRGLYERCLAIYIRKNGRDGYNTASRNFNLGLFYGQLAGVQTTVDLKQKQLLLAKVYFEESHRIRTEIFGGSTHPVTIETVLHRQSHQFHLMRENG